MQAVNAMKNIIENDYTINSKEKYGDSSDLSRFWQFY
jgi:hypothetical protein